MSAGLTEYKNSGITYTDNQAFRAQIIIDSDGIRVSEEIVPFLNLETTETVNTTDATVTTIATIEVPDHTTMFITAKVLARVIDESGAGDVGDALVYEIKGAFKCVSGVTSQVGSTVNVIAEKDQAAFDVVFTVSSPNVLIEVNGDTNNEVDWACYVQKHILTTIVEVIPP